jgi:hypothetical protein
MRKIEFRGKRTDNGEWVYGGFTPDAIGHPRITVKDGDGLLFPEVVPKTLGQYTGNNDKNGVNIFEGDIVLDSRGCRTVVEYVNGGFHSCDDAYSIGYYAPMLLVIGNIHDNPELLRGK